MSSQDTGDFDVLDGFPADVVAVSAKGRIGRNAYEATLMPLVEARIASQGRIKLLYEIGDAFEGYTAGAMWDDAKLGLMHLADFVRVAVVTDVEWIRLGIKMFAPLMRSDVQVFHLADRDSAKTWISENAPPAATGPQVAADHKVAPL